MQQTEVNFHLAKARILRGRHIMDALIGSMNRRTFLNNTVKVVGGGAALGSSALSYGRIAGANDRISLGHIGIGNRGARTGLDCLAA